MWKYLMSGMFLVGMSQTVQAVPIESVGNVSVWNVGTGQANGDFQVTDDTAFTGGAIQLGIRTTLRQVGNITPTGDTYTVEAGIQPGTESNPRARWNFDWHVEYDGTVADLDALTLSIASTNANTPVNGGMIDLLDPTDLSGGLTIRDLIDCHIIGCATSSPPAGGSSDAGSGSPTGVPDPTHFYQSSQNPVFGWFTPSFDSDLTGQYTFTLTATEGGTTVEADMIVNVVPEPSTTTLLLIGTAAIVSIVSRRFRHFSPSRNVV